MSKTRLVVIGGSAAGMSAASQAKRRDPNVEVLVFEAGRDVSYLSCGLPYFLGGVVTDLEELYAIGKDALTRQRGLQVRTGMPAVQVDTRNGRVRVIDRETGAESVEAYDALCVATGASVTVPEVGGRPIAGVFTLRNPDDALRIRDYIQTQKPRTAAILGAGYLGLEMAENLANVGMSVTVIERQSSVMSHIGPEIGQSVIRVLHDNGVEILLDAEIDQIDGDDKVRCVRTASQDVDADLVVLATGITPNSQIAVDAGIRVGAAGAIAVDEYQETSAPGVFAAGDCAESLHLVTGRKTYVPLGPTANKQGRVAGANAVGGREIFHGIVGTRIVRIFGLEVARTGLTQTEALEAGYAAEAKTVKSSSRANYYPGGGEVFVKIVYDRDDGRMLGAQICGPEGVKGRIDVCAAALTRRMTVAEFADLDLAYAPPFSPVWDPILVASNVAKRGLRVTRPKPE